MTRCLASSISRAPVPYDLDQAKDLVSRLPDSLASGSIGELVLAQQDPVPFSPNCLESKELG